MMMNNGGSIIADDDEWQLHPIFDDGDRKRIARTCNDVVRETAAFDNLAGFPSAALVFAGNGSGDCLLFLRAGTAFDPAPWCWRHETRTLTRHADDVGQFFSGEV